MTKNHKFIYWLVFTFGLLLLVFIQYYGLVHFNYLVPPGDDGANHLGMATPFFENKITLHEYLKIGSYPPGFHIFLAKTAHIFDTYPLDILLWVYPAVIVLSGLAVFILTYFTFGLIPALISFFVYSFFTRSPIQLLNDGGYPNLIAGHFLLPITFTFLILANRNKKLKKLYLFLSFVPALLVFATHHISTFYLLGILGMLIPIYFIISGILNKNTKQTFAYIACYLFALVLLLFLFNNLSFFAPAKRLASLMFISTEVFPYFKIANKLQTPEAIIGFTEIPTRIGRLATVTGILGLISLPITLKRELKKKFIYPLLLFSVWVFILLLGSQLTFLTNPERMARDLAVPLSIISGATIYYIYKQIKELKPTHQTFSLPLFFLAIGFLGFSQIRDRIDNSIHYEPMVRYTEADYVTLKQIQDRSTVLIYAYNFYVPFINNDLLFQNAYATSPSLRYEPEFINQFDYIYISQQTGWVPSDFRPNLADQYQNNPKYYLVAHNTSLINDVYLFQKK